MAFPAGDWEQVMSARLDREAFAKNIVPKRNQKKASPGQMSLLWHGQKVTESTEVQEVARKFVTANCYNPPVPGHKKLQC